MKRRLSRAGGHHRTADFPGYQAGASLKRRRIRRVGSRHDHFPGYQAGASLKRARPRPGGDQQWRLPRLPSRGLIEAGRAGSTRSAWRPVLPRLPSRGLIEAMSLTLGTDGRAVLPRLPSRGLIEAKRSPVAPSSRPALPRLPSRGLIEASTATTCACVRSGDFPGYQAGASLKRRHRGRRRDRHVDFPGYQAGASLKPSSRRCGT